MEFAPALCTSPANVACHVSFGARQDMEFAPALCISPANVAGLQGCAFATDRLKKGGTLAYFQFRDGFLGQ